MLIDMFWYKLFLEHHIHMIWDTSMLSNSMLFYALIHAISCARIHKHAILFTSDNAVSFEYDLVYKHIIPCISVCPFALIYANHFICSNTICSDICQSSHMLWYMNVYLFSDAWVYVFTLMHAIHSYALIHIILSSDTLFIDMLLCFDTWYSMHIIYICSHECHIHMIMLW